MDLVELGKALGAFFEDTSGPSHTDLDAAVARSGLAPGDPRGRPGPPVGKMRRVREILVHATDHDSDAGLKFARQVINLLRADGAFLARTDGFAGEPKVEALRRALSTLGLDLDPTGAVRRIVIDNLEGTELTEALKAYVNRINANPDDAPLQVGTGKELDEAAARHVLMERTGDYPIAGHAGSFPVTLGHAFTLLGFAMPDTPILDPDPHRAVQQALFLLATAVNRLRNDAGTGHGRPDPPRKTSPLTAAEGRLVARATALVAGALLDEL